MTRIYLLFYSYPKDILWQGAIDYLNKTPVKRNNVIDINDKYASIIINNYRQKR